MLITGRKAFQGDRKASTKAVKWESDWQIQQTARGPVAEV